ncbi:unnamed protein product, partial [Brassica oleracea var. botrytis]
IQDDTYLIWYCGRKEKRLKLNSVTRIIPGQGQRTVIFRRYPQPTKEYQSISLIYGNRSLDLVFKDKNEAEFWITTLRTLLSRNSSSALVLHSRSRSFVLDYGEQSSSSNNFRSAGSDTSCEIFKENQSKSKPNRTKPNQTKPKPNPNQSYSGDLYAWGDGAHNAGLLGLGSETSHWKPVRILGQMEGQALIPREVETLSGRKTIKIACGVWHSAAVVSVSGDATSSGKLFVWGDGEDEKLGHDDNKESRLIPSCVITTLDTTSLVDRTLLLLSLHQDKFMQWGHPFNYMRKLHNCYNSGSVLCASKKSLAAAMAPKTNRPYRVYDDCYIKLVGAREYLGTPASSARFSNVHLPSSINEMDAIGTTPQRQLLRVDSFDFFR